MAANVGSRAEIQGFEGKTPLNNMAQIFSNLPFFLFQLNYISFPFRPEM